MMNSFVTRLNGLLAVVFIVLMSCSESVPELSSARNYPVILSMQDDMTKLGLNGSDLFWEDTDKLRITAVASDKNTGTAELSIYNIDDSDNGKARFSGFVNMISEPQHCYFTYPVSTALFEVDVDKDLMIAHLNLQSGTHTPFLYADSEYDAGGMHVRMSHLCAMLEIDVAGEGMKDVAYIAFAGNRKEPLSPISVDLNTGKYILPDKANGSNVQLMVPRRTDGNTYIAVPPVDFEKGFSLILADADGNCMFKSYSSDGTNAGGYNFTQKAGHIIPISIEGDFSALGKLVDGEFLPTGIVCEAFPASHIYEGNLLKGTDISFKMTKTGAPDKLIEEWGAKLIQYRRDDKGNDVEVVYRSVSYTNATPISGQKVTMNVADGWKLLPAGTYYLTPYYKMYGENVPRSLPTREIQVSNPDIRIELKGMTSYDKYLAKRYDEANNYSRRNYIDEVGFVTNLHQDLFTYSAKLNGSDLGTGYATTSDGERKVSYGTKECSAWGTYPFRVSVSISAWEEPIVMERDFHITGLPYEADFTTGDPQNLSPAWKRIDASYSDSRVIFNPDGQSSLRSPAFYVPDGSIYVKTACNSRHNVTKRWSPTTVDMTISTCSASELQYPTGSTLSFTEDYYQSATDAKGLSQKGYLYCNSSFQLTTEEPALMYGLNITNGYVFGDIFVSFKHKVEYSNN